jgi:prenyltransferase beta subunit
MGNKLPNLSVLKATASLRAMLKEMLAKDIELRRITKTASLLLMSGLSPTSISKNIIKRCKNEQNKDGGWIAITDTIWNIVFLSLYDNNAHQQIIDNGINYIEANPNKNGLWGRSSRDMSRIPVSGLLLAMIPQLQKQCYLQKLEELWKSEINSLTYKAAYTLMAFSSSEYVPQDSKIINDTISWLSLNQRQDGSFAPWKEHPVASDVFCTSIAILGLLEYKDTVSIDVFKKTRKWLEDNQLKNGIWAFHEIEDGASWGLYALKKLNEHLETANE